MSKRNTFLRLEWVEREAQTLRRLLDLAPLDILDPYALASKMKVTLYHFFDIASDLPIGCVRHLLCENPGGWSAGSIHLASGKTAVVMNPTHAETRKRATLMEELAHVHLGHRPTQLIEVNDQGISFSMRSYDQRQEKEAYWIGAAALITRETLCQAKMQGTNRQTLAQHFGVSLDLVTFRSNITRTKLD